MGAALAAGQVSALDSPIGFAGYVFSDANLMYTVRSGSYSSAQGRLLERGSMSIINKYVLTGLDPISRVWPPNAGALADPPETVWQCAVRRTDMDFGTGGITQPHGFCREIIRTLNARCCAMSPCADPEGFSKCRSQAVQAAAACQQSLDCWGDDATRPGADDALPACGVNLIFEGRRSTEANCLTACDAVCPSGGGNDTNNNKCRNFCRKLNLPASIGRRPSQNLLINLWRAWQIANGTSDPVPGPRLDAPIPQCP